MSTQTRPAGLRAADVSRQLADAGHQRATWTDKDYADWSPGYRATQCGAGVAVEGPRGQFDADAYTRQLDAYALTLANLGYRVETAPRAGLHGDSGRTQLVVSRRTPTKIEESD